MKYSKIISGEFKSRPNRFIAKVIINGIEETVHVKNTGRCKELLIEGCKVYLSESDNKERKTKYDLIAVEKVKETGEKILINMDSQAPNDVAYEWLKTEFFKKGTNIRREVKFGDSRFDLYAENEEEKAFIEVKGVTLEKDGVALFPDAPTLRGVKHINELIKAKECGFSAYILFVVQMKGVHTFLPNAETHPEFAKVLKNAYDKGVNILVYDCIVTPDSLKIDSEIKKIIFY